MECNYNYDGFCTHDQCPARGDFCPVPDTDGICQYEDREDERYVLTPKGCLLLALLDNGICLNGDILDNIWDVFSETMESQGYIKEE